MKAGCHCIHCALMSTMAQSTAFTTYGTNGVKVWIFKGEILEHDPMAQDKRMNEPQDQGSRGRRDRDAA